MPRIGHGIALIGFVAAALLQPGLLRPVLAEPPKFQVDPTWPQTLPSNWIIGTIGGIFVDAQDHIWINQRPSSLDAREKRASTATNVICCVPAPPVIEFDQAGKVVQGWGGDGPDYKWGNDGHGIFVVIERPPVIVAPAPPVSVPEASEKVQPGSSVSVPPPRSVTALAPVCWATLVSAS